MAVDGAHHHAKVNPGGYLFEIACYRPVPGIVAVGRPSAEFSWFDGYRWQLALCGGCGAHLGWYFEGDEPFGALIRDRIDREESERET